MKNHHYFLAVLLYILLPNLKANAEIAGLIVNSQTNKAIPFVNISIKNTHYGTVSDINGNYKFVVSSKYNNATICFSCIGYNSKEISIHQLKNKPNISLVPADVQLSEVTIMPDSTLRSFLKRAYNKIPDNYPNTPTQYEGFYREGLQTSHKKYIRLVEAITRSNKSSYKNKQSGTVQIIKSRKYIDADSTANFPTNFYGGPHFVHELDCVKARYSFLKPHKNYEYTYEGLTLYQGHKVHEISFKPQSGQSMRYEGTMYIAAETLSYLKFELKLTKYALDKRFDKFPLPGLNLVSKEKTYVINYELKDSTCFLKSIYENETIHNKKNEVFYSPLEFVITDIKTSSVTPLPYNIQIPLSYVPSFEATDYHHSDWKNYSTLADAIVVDTIVAKQVFKAPLPNKKAQFKQFISKLNLAYKIAYQPYQMPSGDYQVNFEGTSYQQDLSNAGTTLALDMLIAYKLTKRFNMGYGISSGLSNNNIQDSHGPVLEYKFPLKTMGKDIYFSPSLAYMWHKFGRSVGTQNIDSDFSFGGKTFKNNQVQALAGIQHQGFQIGGSFLYQLSALFYLDVAAHYYRPTSTTDVLYLKEKSGFFLTRKKAHEAFSERDATLYINGVETQSSGVKYDNWSVSVGFRMMF